MEPTRGYYNTFVVRVWHDETEGVTRGYIQHVSTQERAHFTNLPNMNSFILSHLPSNPCASITPEGAEAESVMLSRDFGGGTDE